jgi:hypothetical protein
MSSRSGDREEVGGRLGSGPALRGPRLTTRRSLTRRNSTPERAASRGHDGGAAHPTRSVRHESSNLALIPACGPRPGQPTPKPAWLPPPHPGPGRARRFRDRNLAAATLDRHSATTPVGQTLAIPMSHAHEGDKTRSQRSLRAHFRRSGRCYSRPRRAQMDHYAAIARPHMPMSVRLAVMPFTLGRYLARSGSVGRLGLGQPIL